MIFISHRKVDEGMAVKISEYLKAKGIQSWVDALDPATRNGATDITKHIISTLDKCSHLIVVFSINTVGSMWVPFELGAAYNAEKGIGTYLIDNASNPEYLNAFPRMKNGSDLDYYIAEYQSDKKVRKSFITESDASISAVGKADSFIQRMKTRLGQ